MEKRTNPEVKELSAALESAGVSFSGKQEIVERMEQATNWRYALQTIVMQGERIHLGIKAAPTAFSEVLAVLSRHGFQNDKADACARKICLN